MITGAEEIGGDGGGIGLTRLFGCRRASHLQQEIQNPSDSEEESKRTRQIQEREKKRKG